MTIVEASVLALGQLHHPHNRLLLDLALTRATPVAMNHSLGPHGTDSAFNPVTLPLTYSQYQSRLYHRQLTSIHSLYNLQPLLFFHGQGCHPATLT
jgi:hypothetical protein